MTTEPGEWRPLHLRGTDDDDAADEYGVLHDGVPDWLEPSLFRWVADRAAEGGAPLAQRAERYLRIRLPEGGNKAQLVAYWGQASVEMRLTLIDFLLHDLEMRHKADLPMRPIWGNEEADKIARAVAGLALALTEGGSLWRFESEPHWGLVRRVSDAAQRQVSAATSPATDASKRLSAAWSACYRQHPNYDEAYRNAVLAVEAVVLPATIPNDQAGTLGKAIRHVRDTLDRWSVAGLGTERLPSGQVLLSMLDLLWTNQQRHAKGNGAIVNVTQQEAEAAVSLAVTIVQWFSSRLVTQG